MAAVPSTYGYIGAVAALSWFVHHGYMASQVMAARKKYNVKYPNLYADKDNCPAEEQRHAFNCVQRAHQNSLENQPVFLVLLATAGLKHPITAAVSGLVYLVGKIMYFKGYSSGNPEKRMQGAASYLGLLTLLGVNLTWGVKTALAALGK